MNVKDKPQSDPVGIMVGKVDAYTNKNKPQGSASLEGAEFTICYYDTDGDVPNDYESYTGKKAKWVLKTDFDGYCNLSKDYLVSGDELFYVNNAPTLPLGTITIQETKAPEGYKLDDTIFVQNITSDSKTENIETYNAPEVEEEAFYGSFELTKFMSDDEASGASVAEVGAKFVAILDKYYNEANGDAAKALELAKANGTDKEYSQYGIFRL